MTVAVVDYGMCNLDSVVRMLEVCGEEAVVASVEADFDCATHILLPGVGSFAEAMKQLRDKGLEGVISKLVLEQNVPILGICLGMQLLASYGEEGGGAKGLGLIPGRVEALMPRSSSERVPHIGWNELEQYAEHVIFDGVKNNSDFYFVHSYCVNVDDEYVLGRTPFCGGFPSVIASGRIVGVQFHPEKSQRVGRQLLSNFLKM